MGAMIDRIKATAMLAACSLVSGCECCSVHNSPEQPPLAATGGVRSDALVPDGVNPREVHPSASPWRSGGGDASTNRPAAWAQTIELRGVPNLHQVSSTLYRSAQPTADGMRNLRQMGIRTIINLRSFHSDRDKLGRSDLVGEHIYMKAWHPEKEDAIRFLQLVNDPERTPVLVHCQQGADRTGTMCAVYRVVVEGWTKEEAVREMKTGGFGFHAAWQNLPAWIRDLDVEAIKREAGIKRTQSGR